MSGGCRTHDRCPMAPRGCGRRSRRPQGVGSSGVKCIPRLSILGLEARPGQTFIDSRDSPVLIVHKGIPELAESDRLGTWGGVRVGGPGVSSPQGYPPAFLAPVFQLRVVYDRPSALYMDSRDTGVLIVHKVSPRSSRRETRPRSPGLHKPAPCLLLGIKPLVAGYAWAPWRRSTRRRSLLNPVD